MVGWTCDQAGNLSSDGASTYMLHALTRLIAAGQTRAHPYNGEGTLLG